MTDKSTCEMLAEALRPFATAADEFDGTVYNEFEEPVPFEDDAELEIECVEQPIMIGDLRRAREALSRYEAERAAANIRNGVG